MNFIEKTLDNMTMYRVVLYCLSFLVLYSIVLSFFGINGTSFYYSTLSLFAIVSSSIVGHFIFEKIFKSPANIESTFITSFILFLTIAQASNYKEIIPLVISGISLTAFKYLISFKKKHIFNPAGIVLFVLGISGIIYPTWWIANKWTFIPIIIVAFLIIKKIRRGEIFFVYMFSVIILGIIFGNINSISIYDSLSVLLISSPFIFFGSVMLIEPSTLPDKRINQIIYAFVVALFCMIPVSYGFIYNTPEFALFLGNIFAFAVSKKGKYVLKIKETKKLSNDIVEFVMRSDRKIKFEAGQYMEWTLPHKSPDLRGIKRYFTISSSPLDEDITLTTKFVTNGLSSSFKNKLINSKVGQILYGSQVEGSFVLPKDNSKIVFIAGGIGITPFISMIRTFLKGKEKRDVTMFYLTKYARDIVYMDTLEKAIKENILKLVNILSDDNIPTDAKGNYEKGFLTKEILNKYITKPNEFIFFISGPHKMVESYEELLKSVGVKKEKIITDYFPGF